MWERSWAAPGHIRTGRSLCAPVCAGRGAGVTEVAVLCQDPTGTSPLLLPRLSPRAAGGPGLVGSLALTALLSLLSRRPRTGSPCPPVAQKVRPSRKASCWAQRGEWLALLGHGCSARPLRVGAACLACAVPASVPGSPSAAEGCGHLSVCSKGPCGATRVKELPSAWELALRKNKLLWQVPYKS